MFGRKTSGSYTAIKHLSNLMVGCVERLTANVMIADDKNTIVYANNAVLNMLRT